jgi:NAD(P)-binding Rossmann-like domain
MTASRRDFLKFIVAGSVTAGCPVDLSLLASPQGAQSQIDGDHFEICHEVRDGHAFAKPPVSKRYDVVVVGGGASGLAAAHFLQNHDFLLLEKEPHWGGNATLGESHGQVFCTGSAFDYKGSASDRLAREIGLAPICSLIPKQSAIVSRNSALTCWHWPRTRIKNSSTMSR